MEELPKTEKKDIPEKEPNNNKVFELMSMGKDLLTSPDKVYRSITGNAAIADLKESGIVRNRQSAGLQENRYGKAVYWSRGGDGKYHPVPKGGYVIEAPFSIASERTVKKEDVTAIYTKNEDGQVVDTLQQRTQLETENVEIKKAERKSEDENKIQELRRSLGLTEEK